jgi:hypothetical protein
VIFNRIHVLSAGAPDRSRWIELNSLGSSSVEIDLSESCQPGRASRLLRATCPASMLEGILSAGGSIQMTMSNGYLLLRSDRETFTFEFREHQDQIATKCATCAEDVRNALTYVREGRSQELAATH